MNDSEINEIIEESANHVAELNSEIDDYDVDALLEEADKILQSNSKTVLVDETTVRFSGADWYQQMQKENILIAGVGGIGSWVSLLISRMKPLSMYIYDMDTVERVNMAGQLYKTNDIGMPKVDAIANTVKYFSEYNSVFAVNDAYTEDSPASDIMICGFDNMGARKTFFNQWIKYLFNKDEEARKKCLFIDGRLNSEEFQILCIRGDDDYNINEYKYKYLFEDNAVEEAVCSYKQTTYCASMIASFITNLLVNFVSNKGENLVDRDLPFFTYYDAKTMFLKTEN